MATLSVDLGERSYPILVGPGLLEEQGLIARYIAGNEVLVITNETVAPLYLDKIIGALDRFNVTCQVLPDGEQHKSLETLQGIFDTLLRNRLSRGVTLVALGGGVIGDIAGFAAACYQRGVAFVQVPTTLLAQVDSAVGGKTAVNHPLGKNMIGAFHQPTCVVSDTHTLTTLAPRELSAGLAEVFKYGLIRDASFFKWLEDNVEQLLTYDHKALEHVIVESCRHKAEVVAQDEREAGQRALLNLGHTFGHAIETASGYGQWLHGEAVAVGMLMAASMSERLGWIESSDVQRIQTLLTRANLPVAAPKAMSTSDFLDHMSVDKKVTDGRIRLVLLKGIGSAELVAEYPQSLLEDVLSTFPRAG